MAHSSQRILRQITKVAKATDKMAANKFTSPAFINGIYIPSGLLIVGTAICKTEWVPYAVALALVLGGWKVFQSRKSSCATPLVPAPRPESRVKL